MESVEKLSAALPPDMARLLKNKVEAGEFASVSEAIREAIRAWQAEEESYEERIAWMRAGINASLDDPSPDMTEEEVKRHLDAFMANVAKRKSDEAA